MSRAIDATFMNAERLAIALAPGDVSATNRVEPDAIDLQGQSCDREKYGTLSNVVSRVTGATGWAWIEAGNMPPPVLNQENAPFVWVPEDCPEPNNSAHAELRVQRNGKTISPKKPSNTVRTLLQQALAARFTVAKAP